MTTEKNHAMYLVNPDTGRVQLTHADDVADQKAAGHTEPKGMKANGDSWNTEEDEAARDAAAENDKVAAKAKAEKDAKKTAELNKAHEANEKAAKEAEQVPDMKVQIVTPKSDSKTKAAPAKRR